MPANFILGKRHSLLLLSCSGALLVAGCTGLGPRTPSEQPPGAQSVREELLQVDRAFAQMACDKGVAEAFYAFAAEDAAIFPRGELPVKGREAIRVAMSSGPDGKLTWDPQDAQACAAREMGYTWGLYQFVASGPNTQSNTNFGKYVTLWKRQTDGGWKFLLDIGNSAPPPRSP